MRLLPVLLGLFALLAGGCASTAQSTEPPAAEPTTSPSAPRSPSLSTPKTAAPEISASVPTEPGISAQASSPPKTSKQPGGKARQQLKQLRRVDRQPSGLPQYVRKDFGSSWSDVDGNGCNQRDDVLLRDARKGTVKTQWQGRCPHDVLAGTWTDPYTGNKMTFTDLKDRKQSMAIQIDHVVPLSEAWRSGAYKWDREQRRQFANDLDNLLAVDGPTNASKSDLDPASWRPRKGYQCAYATRWIGVKHEWELGADSSEVRALGEMLDYCK